MSRLSLYLLGPPRIECDGLPVKVDTRKAIALLAYVAITRETHRRESLINLLWPESDQTRGRANLRRTLYALRQARIADWLDVDREGVCLKPGADVWLDVDQFHAFLAECRTHGHVASEVCPACVTPLTAAATLYRDDFLSGFSLRDSLNFDDWQFFQAEALRQKLAAVLERLVQALSAEGRFESASLCAKRWLALDRLNEAAHRQLMQLYAWSGQRTAALRQYQECVQVLQDQLGADPGESTTALHQAIIEKRVPRPPIDLARSPSREGQVEGILPRPEPRTEAVVSLPARPGDAMIGTLLGNRYRLEARLGRGSLGVVYRARDTLLEREVAVKVLSPRALDTEARARLFQEARAAAQLNHPNIVTVYDIGGIGEPDSPAFIVLEMVDGEALHHRRPQTLAETLSIVRQVCVALEQAHAHGIIHRDLKPENVLLTPDGTAKLMDFGLARTAASRITQEGFVVGTAYYLAPEQALGEELDGRADLYALGVMLYELTTGRLPFTGPNLQAIISQHLYAPVVPPRTHKPALPPALDALIVQLLSKRADERPASAVEVLRALERLEPPTPPVAVDRVAAPSPPPLDRERESPAVPGMDGSMSCTLRIRFLRIRLLGDFSLDFDDAPVSTINTPRLQSLLAYLLLHREAPQPRHHVAYTLWPDSTDAQARSNLRTLFYRLRDALPNADRFLQADAHTLQWRAEGPFTLDVAEFEGYAHPADSPLPVRERLERASAAYGGDLLPGCYDDWILPERERLRQMFYDVLERLILLSEDQRDYQGAIYHGQRLLRHDPLHEATYRRLMRLHALNGDRAGALRVYHTCATVLERELAVEPGPSTQEAYQRLLMREEAATSPPTTPDPLSPLVGRDQEWSRLQATWRRAAAGRASFALLSGEAGIGKTRLAEELVEWANRQGIVTASARCYATEGELAFGPIVAWMRARALPPLDDVWLTEVSRLLPELLAERPDLPTPGPLTQTWQRQRLFEALARGILGYKGPILLVIDDLQWCDRGTLEWLRFLLRFDPRARLLLVGTARSEELHDDHPLASLLLDLRRVDQLVEIELSTLDLTATRALAASVAGRELDLAHAEELHQEAEGNPLYVVEMVRSGLPGEDRVQSGALPAKVEAVIKARLNQLSPSARELVGVAATVGRAFTFDVLAQASGGDEETLVGALDQLWGRRIVREQGADAYDFSHHKIREVAYAELSLARRRLLHRQVAQALEMTLISMLSASRWPRTMSVLGCRDRQSPTLGGRPRLLNESMPTKKRSTTSNEHCVCTRR